MYNVASLRTQKRSLKDLVIYKAVQFKTTWRISSGQPHTRNGFLSNSLVIITNAPQTIKYTTHSKN